MDQWQEFIKTGLVSDYLKYKLKEEKKDGKKSDKIQRPDNQGKENR